MARREMGKPRRWTRVEILPADRTRQEATPDRRIEMGTAGSCHRASGGASGELIWVYGGVSKTLDAGHVRKGKATSNARSEVTWTWRQRSLDSMALGGRSAT